MTSRASLCLRLLPALLAWLACGDDPGPGIDALVVVQETNTPDPPEPCEGFEHRYTVDVVTECGQGTLQVDVCSDEPLCAAQLDQVVTGIRTCDEVHGYETEADADACD
jgi:hypothetical protein